MKVLITGARGMLGSDVVTAADAVHHEVAAFDRSELDVTDLDALRRRFEYERPRAVINCAAYTDVDGAETDEAAAFAINETGAHNVALAAAEVDAKVFYISTDYVFDGLKGEPYSESDQPNPLGVYGRSKLAGELATATANPRHAIVRSSWLFGNEGKNFVRTMLTLAERQNELLVVRDQVGCPTYTMHLADAIVELLDYERFGVLHIASSEYCSWYDFAVEIFRQAQVDVKVLSGTTAMLGRPAPRPPFSAIVSERSDVPTLPRWDHGLNDYLTVRAHRIAAERADHQRQPETPENPESSNEMSQP